MSFVVVYTKKADPYSVRALALLAAKRVPVDERRLPEYAGELLERAGTDQVPQVFINGEHIGGFERLGQLELHGELDRLLARTGGAHIERHDERPRS